MDIQAQKQVPNTNFLDPGKASVPSTDVTVLEPIEKVKPHQVFNPDAPQLDSVGKPDPAAAIAPEPVEEVPEAIEAEPEVVAAPEEFETIEEPEVVSAPAFHPAYDAPSNFENGDIRSLKRNQLITWLLFLFVVLFITIGGYFWLNAKIDQSIQSVSDSTEGKFDSLNQAATLGNLSVLNGASFDDIEVDGNTTLSQLFVKLIKAETVSADALGSKKITVGESVVTDGEESETEYSLLVNGISFTDSLDVGQNLSVGGSTTLSGDVTMGELIASLVEAGTIDAEVVKSDSAEVGGLVITGNGSAGGSFTVAGTTTTSNLSVGNSVSIGGNTVISGILSLASKLFVSGDLTVDTSTLKVDSTNNRVGIGTATPGAKLDVASTTVNGGTNRGILVNVQSSTTSNGTNNDFGVSTTVSETVNSGVTDSGSALATDSTAVLTGATTGTLVNAYGLRTNAGLAAGATGTLTNAYGAYFRVVNSGTGTITNGYGAYISDVQATNDYGVYQAGANDDNYFAGQVGIGINSPNALLHVDGDTIVAGSLTVGGHIVSENDSGTTTIAAGLAACTAPTVTVNGNDTAGTITITTGTGCAVTGSAAAVTFANAYGAAPRVVLSADNDNAADGNFFTSARTTTGVEIHTSATLTDSTTYTFNYIIIE